MKSQLCFRDAFQDALPVVVSGFVFGLVFGVLAVKAGLTAYAATLMSLLVFACASQFIAVEQWQAGQFSLVAVLMTTLLVNLRHLLMCLSLRLSFHEESRGRLLPAFALLLIDETWALVVHRFKRSAPSLRYFIQIGLLIYCGWLGGTLLGTQLGSQNPKPAEVGLDFLFVGMFLSLMVLLWQRSLDFLTWLLAGAIAFAFAVAKLPAVLVRPRSLLRRFSLGGRVTANWSQESVTMSGLEWGAIIGMALVTYLTRVGGLSLLSRHRYFSGFVHRFLQNLPAALLAALIGPKLAASDPSIWGAVLATVLAVWTSRNTLLGVVPGTGGCTLIRWLMT